jgi:hypothetical protein
MELKELLTLRSAVLKTMQKEYNTTVLHSLVNDGDKPEIPAAKPDFAALMGTVSLAPSPAPPPPKVEDVKPLTPVQEKLVEIGRAVIECNKIKELGEKSRFQAEQMLQTLEGEVEEENDPERKKIEQRIYELKTSARVLEDKFEECKEHVHKARDHAAAWGESTENVNRAIAEKAVVAKQGKAVKGLLRQKKELLVTGEAATLEQNHVNGTKEQAKLDEKAKQLDTQIHTMLGIDEDDDANDNGDANGTPRGRAHAVDPLEIQAQQAKAAQNNVIQSKAAEKHAKHVLTDAMEHLQGYAREHENALKVVQNILG